LSEGVYNFDTLNAYMPPPESLKSNGGNSKRNGWIIAGCVVLLFILAAGWFVYRRPMSVADAILRTRLRIAGVDSRYVEVGPYRVHYFVGGHGKPLLLIHGLGARAEDWAPEMPGYARHGFRVYAIDLLGYGRTSRPDIAYTIAEQADLVNGFLHAMHLQHLDIAGWSMGGWVALQYTLAHQQRVERLVLMDSAGLLFETTYGPNVFTPKTPEQLDQLTDLLTPHPDPLPGFVARDVLRRMAKIAPVVHRTVQTMMTGQDLLDGRLQQIHVPVLIVWGAQDTLIPPSSAEQMHGEMPQSVLEVFNGCGHIAPLTCATQIVPRVRQFLNSSPAMAGGTYHY
jgi:pimeloyl-ACP methyl ester carboxylesterase